MPDDETLDLTDAVEIFNDGVYRAVLLEIEPFYRWFIFRKEEMIQEGVSISEAAGQRAVSSILYYFHKVDDKIDSYQTGRGQTAEPDEVIERDDDGLTDLFDRKFFREKE